LGSNLPAFPSDGELNPPPNSLSNLSNGNDDGLLLFSEGGLLLFLLKALNFSNRLFSIVLKYKNIPSPMFLILVILFC